MCGTGPASWCGGANVSGTAVPPRAGGATLAAGGGFRCLRLGGVAAVGAPCPATGGNRAGWHWQLNQHGGGAPPDIGDNYEHNGATTRGRQ